MGQNSSYNCDSPKIDDSVQTMGQNMLQVDY